MTFEFEITLTYRLTQEDIHIFDDNNYMITLPCCRMDSRDQRRPCEICGSPVYHGRPPTTKSAGKYTPRKPRLVTTHGGRHPCLSCPKMIEAKYTRCFLCINDGNCKSCGKPCPNRFLYCYPCSQTP